MIFLRPVSASKKCSILEFVLHADKTFNRAIRTDYHGSHILVVKIADTFQLLPFGGNGMLSMFRCWMEAARKSAAGNVCRSR